MNKRFELVKKKAIKRTTNPQNHSNEEPLAYVSTYNKNNPELFIEITKNLEELENNDRKKMPDETKIIKSYRQARKFKTYFYLIYIWGTHNAWSQKMQE